MRGRPKHNEEKIGVKTRIRKSLYAQVHLILLDPLRGKVSYGDWTGLMEHLLEEWLEKQKANGAKDGRSRRAD